MKTLAVLTREIEAELSERVDDPSERWRVERLMEKIRKGLPETTPLLPWELSLISRIGVLVETYCNQVDEAASYEEQSLRTGSRAYRGAANAMMARFNARDYAGTLQAIRDLNSYVRAPLVDARVELATRTLWDLNEVKRRYEQERVLN